MKTTPVLAQLSTAIETHPDECATGGMVQHFKTSPHGQAELWSRCDSHLNQLLLRNISHEHLIEKQKPHALL